MPAPPLRRSGVWIGCWSFFKPEERLADGERGIGHSAAALCPHVVKQDDTLKLQSSPLQAKA